MITGPIDTIKRARRLRSEATLPEGLLLRELRKRPNGLKFRWQHGAGNYVLDFYCAAARLAIEVDGFAHETGEVVRKDATRSLYLRSQGVATLRVPAKVILSDIQAAIARIVEVCEERIAQRRSRPTVPLHHPADGSPPRSGEE
jgi:very-short-patch-repair endonuclease